MRFCAGSYGVEQMLTPILGLHSAEIRAMGPQLAEQRLVVEATP